MRLEDFGHNSITDLPLLDAEEYTYPVDPVLGLGVVRRLLRGFLDRYLQDQAEAMTGLGDLERVTLETFSRH